MGLLASSPALAEPARYLCTASHVTGMRYDFDANDWKPMQFKAGDKYVFARIPESEYDEFGDNLKAPLEFNLLPLSTYKIVSIWKFDKFREPSSLRLFTCAKYFIVGEKFTDGPYYSCKGGIGSGGFEESSLRFSYAVTYGYTDQGYDENFRRKNPEQYQQNKLNGQALDPNHPDDISITIGKCEPM